MLAIEWRGFSAGELSSPMRWHKSAATSALDQRRSSEHGRRGLNSIDSPISRRTLPKNRLDQGSSSAGEDYSKFCTFSVIESAKSRLSHPSQFLGIACSTAAVR